MHNLKNILLIVSSVLLLAACGSSVKLDEPAPIDDKSSTSGDTRAVSTVSTTSGTLDGSQQGILSQRSVYFDYDSFIVKDEYKAMLQAHARHLSGNKNKQIVIQGNTDERGGREYNLALGQKRAEAVRRTMSLLGVQENQMEAVSFGKEKPKAEGSGEAAWAENRRADLVYQ